MKLYVCNCTGQHRVVYTRLDFAVDEHGRKVHEKAIPPRLREIPARAQVLFGDYDHASQLQEIVTQLEAMGAVHADAVRTAKLKGQVKLVWQQDKPIPLPILKDVVEHNMGYLSAEGAERRRRLSIASDHLLAQDISKIPEVGQPRMFETEFETEGEEDPDVPGRVEQGITIKHTKPEPAKPRPRRQAA